MDFHRVFCCAIVIIFTVGAINLIDAKQIVGVFPHFGYSHFKVFYPLLRNLAERGHHVTVVTYIRSPDQPLDTYEEWLMPNTEVVNVVPLTEWKPRTWYNLADEYWSLHVEGQNSCKKLYESGFIQKLLQRHLKKPFDILVTEYFNSDCQLSLAHLMDVPIVALSSCLPMPWYYDRIVLPDTPSYVQSEFIGFSTPLSWYERLTNFLQAKLLKMAYRYHTNGLDNALIQRYLNVTIDVNEIANKRTSLLLTNQHYSVSGIRPHSEQLVEIGGIHIQEKNINSTLSPEIEEFLSRSKGDVLFISWGSMIRASTIDQRKLKSIISVLEKLKMKVIWKWETENLPLKNEHILFVKWAPQLQLLCHKKVKMFWGHGGLLGTTEAVYCGKPLIVTPIYGDQFVNAYAVRNRKIAHILDYNEINEKNLENALQQIQQKSFAENAIELSKIFRDRPLKPLDTATWWVEYLLNQRRSSEILHTHAVDLNWFVYNSLDSIAIILLVSVIGIFFFRFLVLHSIYIVNGLCKPLTKLKKN